MNRFIKKENVLKVIIILTIINFALMGSIAYHVFWAQHHDQRHESPEKYMKSKLGLDEKQDQKFREFKQTYSVRIKEIQDQISIDKKHMMDELNKETPDEKILDSISLEMGYKIAELKKASYRHYLELKSVIDTSQQRELNRVYRRIVGGEERGYRHKRRNEHRK